jgi:hypothetical protein
MVEVTWIRLEKAPPVRKTNMFLCSQRRLVLGVVLLLVFMFLGHQERSFLSQSSLKLVFTQSTSSINTKPRSQPPETAKQTEEVDQPQQQQQDEQQQQQQDEQQQQDVQQQQQQDEQRQHVVFIGDSTLRYSYLEWIDQDFYNRDDNSFAPPELVHEKRHASWTDFFNYTTLHFHGHMACDCQRSETWDLNTEVENRYYSRDQFTATYLQGYGDNMAHGRYLPQDVHLAQITDPENSSLPILWREYGGQWDKMFLGEVALLLPRPTAIVLNAGLWPNVAIARNMGSILRAALQVVGSQGHVIWRATLKRQTEGSAVQSDSDQAAQEWSYRLPGVLYQPFPNLTLTDTDYFDPQHFSEPRVYREWNADLTRVLKASVPKKNRVFVVVGAVRTLQKTEESFVMNLITPLCPPSTCVAHLVTHLSYSDNRPSFSDGAMGMAIMGQDHGNTTFFQQVDVPDGFLKVYTVPRYNIASDEERHAMETMEEECSDASIAARMRMFRRGDPRRYSMWFARAWAWRFVQQLERDRNNVPFDYYTFARPDMLWMIPAPTMNFIEDFGPNDVWLHDSYYGIVPDTFALLPTSDLANTYFSLEELVKPGVVCLGGSGFNQSVVAQRLEEEGIAVNETDWCRSDNEGWSEHILTRKLVFANFNLTFFPAGTTIMRPPDVLECQPLHSAFQHGRADTHAKSNVALFTCILAAHGYQNSWNSSTKSLLRPFRWRGQGEENNDKCLTLYANVSLVPVLAPCEYPIPFKQMFAESAAMPTTLFGLNEFEWSIVIVNGTTQEFGELWMREEPIELYSAHTLDPKSRRRLLRTLN